MSSVVAVSVHSSQFPENVQDELLRSLRTRRINHKFHYHTVKQAQQWLAVHQAYSPAQTDPDCAAIYDSSFDEAQNTIGSTRLHVISLGSGGGQKEAPLLSRLCQPGKEICYTPSDVSLPLLLAAYQRATEMMPEAQCHPLLCDLLTSEDLPQVLAKIDPPGSTRVIVFFGMLPNFEPQAILPKLCSLLRSEDWLLLSANLAPGLDYDAGIGKILPLYDNALTRDWLLTFLLDLGVDRCDGAVRFQIEEFPAESGFKRVSASFHFRRERRIRFGEEEFCFQTGDAIGLFFSYRYTPDRLTGLLGRYGIRIWREWITRSGEEGVFLCRRE